MGLVCTDGIVLGVERLLHSKLLVKGSNRRIQSADEHIGLATAGLLADGKHMGSRAREECANFRDTYNSPVTVGVSLSRAAHMSNWLTNRYWQIDYQDMFRLIHVMDPFDHSVSQLW